MLLAAARARMSGPFWSTCEAVARPVTARWPPHSRLILVSDGPGWVIEREAIEHAAVARRLGIRVASARWLRCSRHQSVFFGSHDHLLAGAWLERPHRFATAYFHGRPGTGVPKFDEAFRRFRLAHHRIDRIQVSHRAMRDVVLEAGVEAGKVFVIPIGVNLAYFTVRTPESRRRVRKALGIPDAAFVVGSFQKDGVGWGEGIEPKLEKGPDVLLDVIARLRRTVPGLFVLLTGPARGYVKAGLTRLGVPFHHVRPRQYAAVARAYHALDVYLVTSRDEGGPKAALESMAAGVPLVTTPVGQAADLVEHGESGWIAGAEDVEGLAALVEHLASHPAEAAEVAARARPVAERHSYEAQAPLWRRFWDGFVAMEPQEEGGRP